ncbi:MAG TPA: Crp/Fnr family transcriptional regulator [Caldilineae bacterium]|nr:Crp/Fnr family transcriptional regulator [Caldilineae bacterium]
MNDLSPTSVLTETFAELPPARRFKVREIFHERKFSAGETIFLQEDPASAIYLITEGRIKIERVTPDGYQSVLCVRGPGDIFCPVPLLDRGTQLGTARAMTDVTLLWAEREEFNIACADCSQLMALVQRDCLLEVRRIVGRMESFAFRNIRERVAYTVLEESARNADHGEPQNELRITHQELAGLVGASRESVSRTLSKLEQAGMVETGRGRLIIRDRAKLQRILR